MRRGGWWSAVLLAMVGCAFDAAVPTGTSVACTQDGECPSGLVCQPRLGRCVKADAPEREAPSLVSAEVERLLLKRGDVLRVSIVASEPLAQAATARLVQTGRQVPLGLTRGAALETRFSYELTIGPDELEGPATIAVDLIDASGNEAPGIPAATVELDFTPPRISSLNFLSPRTGDGGVLEVRGDEDVSVRLVMSERVQPNASLAVRALDCDVAAPQFTLVAASGSLVDFVSRAPTGQSGCSYAIELFEVFDVAGNVARRVEIGARYRIDAEPPTIAGLETGWIRDGGFTPADTFSLAPRFNRLGVRFRVDDTATEVTTRLDETVLPGCALPDCARVDGGALCRCDTAVAAPWTEGPHVVSVVSRDVAGNVRALSSPVVFDFSPPRVLPATVQLQLTPPPGCPLAAVSALGLGATARVVFSVDEALAGDPSVHTSPVELTWVKESQAPTSFVYRSTLSATGTGQGPQQVSVTVEDAVGNSAQVDLSALGVALAIDTVAPLTPDTERDGGLLYDRRPWGDDQAPPSFTLRAGTGLFEAGAFVRAFDGPDPATASEIGRGPVGGTGALTLPLARADRSVVYVAAVDPACNHSPTADVKHVEWLATLGGKVPGSTVENPHVAEARPQFRLALNQADAVEVTQPSLLQRGDGQALVTSATRTWEQRVRGGLPSSSILSLSPVVYDVGRQRTIATEGSGIVWEWDGSTWVTRGTPGVMQARDAFGFTYDVRRRRAVLFGGWETGAGKNFPETWEWDGEAWTLRADAGAPVDVPHGPSAAYDQARGVTVVVSGGVREWDGEQWTRRTVTGGPSGGAQDTAGAFHEQLQQLVFVDAASGTTWAWSGTAWVRLTPLTGGPVVSFPAMAYDSTRNVLVLQGTGATQRETWEWDGGAWGRRVSEGTPYTWDTYSLTYDPNQRLTVRAGGFNSSSGPPFSVWNGTAWAAQTAPAAWPTFSTGHAAAFDSRRNVTVVWNGGTHEWNGRGWRTGSSAGGPSYGSESAMAFDEVSGRIITFGGGYTWNPRYRDTRAWDGGAWLDMTPLDGGGPSARDGAEMVFDPVRGRLILFGGSPSANVDSNETWSWTAGVWRLLAPATRPPGRNNFTMAYDVARDRVVIFGGGSTNDATWEFDGTTWAQVQPAGPKPASRWDHATAYDSHAQRTLVHGGYLLGESLNAADLWEWDGQQWRDITPVGPKPSGRYRHSLTYDPARRRTVLIGGESNADTMWELSVDPRYRPAQVLRFAFSAAQAGAGSRIERAELSALAGGEGGTPVASGASLWVFDRGAFLKEADTTGSPTSVGALDWTLEDPARLARLLSGQRQELIFAVGSTLPNGDRPASVAVDRLSVKVTYRRP